MWRRSRSSAAFRPRLVPDNLKTGVDKPDLYDPKVNLCRARGASRLPGRSGQGAEAPGQARVEWPMPYVRDSFWCGREFTSLERMQAEAARWSAEVARRPGPLTAAGGETGSSRARRRSPPLAHKCARPTWSPRASSAPRAARGCARRRGPPLSRPARFHPDRRRRDQASLTTNRTGPRLSPSCLPNMPWCPPPLRSPRTYG